jgi:hypothetical protein
VLADEEIAVIEGTGEDLDYDLAGFWLGVGYVVE